MRPASLAQLKRLRRVAAIWLLVLTLVVARGGWVTAQGHDVALGPPGSMAAQTSADDASPGDDARASQPQHSAQPDTSCRFRSTIVTIQQNDGPGAAPAPGALACAALPDLATPGTMTPSEVVASPSARRALLQVYLN